MEDEIIKQLARKEICEIEKHLKLAFRKKFNADFETLFRFAHCDFKRDVGINGLSTEFERYYWCGEEFMQVKRTAISTEVSYDKKGNLYCETITNLTFIY